MIDDGDLPDSPALRDGAPQKSPTIYDVARLAGVSHQTVSRHLRGLDGIRPATRERVTRALETLDYRPNLTARNLATSRSHRVGALTHEIGQVGPSKILQGASAGAREAGYLLDIVSLDVEDPAAVQQALNLITQQDIAGLLVFTSTDAMTQVLRSASIRVPTVIDIEDDEGLLDPLSLDPDRGLAAVVDHLVGLGHRRFFHIAGPQGWVSARNRELSYERALQAHGLTSLGHLVRGLVCRLRVRVREPHPRRPGRHSARRLERPDGSGRTARTRAKWSASAGGHECHGVRRHSRIGVLPPAAHDGRGGLRPHGTCGVPPTARPHRGRIEDRPHRRTRAIDRAGLNRSRSAVNRPRRQPTIAHSSGDSEYYR